MARLNSLVREVLLGGAGTWPGLLFHHAVVEELCDSFLSHYFSAGYVVEGLKVGCLQGLGVMKWALGSLLVLPSYGGGAGGGLKVGWEQGQGVAVAALHLHTLALPPPLPPACMQQAAQEHFFSTPWPSLPPPPLPACMQQAAQEHFITTPSSFLAGAALKGERALVEALTDLPPAVAAQVKRVVEGRGPTAQAATALEAMDGWSRCVGTERD